jgi:acetyl-CoA carboxylase carboxyl transferase subunit beta
LAWFKKARKPIASPAKTSRVPEGLWVKCPECDTVIYTKDLIKNLHVCTKCAHHFRISATDRLKTLFDGERWEEIAPNLVSNDPLKFTDTKPYKSRLAATQKVHRPEGCGDCRRRQDQRRRCRRRLDGIQLHRRLNGRRGR